MFKAKALTVPVNYRGSFKYTSKLFSYQLYPKTFTFDLTLDKCPTPSILLTANADMAGDFLLLCLVSIVPNILLLLLSIILSLIWKLLPFSARFPWFPFLFSNNFHLFTLLNHYSNPKGPLIRTVSFSFSLYISLHDLISHLKVVFPLWFSSSTDPVVCMKALLSFLRKGEFDPIPIWWWWWIRREREREKQCE